MKVSKLVHVDYSFLGLHALIYGEIYRRRFSKLHSEDKKSQLKLELVVITEFYLRRSHSDANAIFISSKGQ